MRIVFMGTPAFAVNALEALLGAGHEIVLVVTQPDRPTGRKRTLTAPPVKVAAMAHALPVVQPERLRKSEAVQRIQSLAPDLIVTAAYGQILPQAVLAIPPLGCINVHASLLPKYRGGAPIQRAVMNGEQKTGVTIMYMAQGLDTGDMIDRVEVPITENDTAGTLFDTCARAGADLLLRVMDQLEQGTVVAIPQDQTQATYAPNLTRADEQVDWTQGATQIRNQLRGFLPQSGVFTSWRGQPFKIWGAQIVKADPSAVLLGGGAVVDTSNAGVSVTTGADILLLTSVQPAGKKVMAAADWSKGARPAPGERFGESYPVQHQ